MNIVKASLDHIPTIQGIAEVAFRDTYKGIISTEQMDYMMDMMYSYESLIRQMMEMNNTFLLLRDEISDKYEGFISYELNYNCQCKTKVHKLYINPLFKGKGLGRLLIETVFEQAKANKNTFLTLNMNRANSSYGFYKHMGFEIADTVNIDIGNGFLMEDYIFIKRL